MIFVLELFFLSVRVRVWYFYKILNRTLLRIQYHIKKNKLHTYKCILDTNELLYFIFLHPQAQLYESTSFILHPLGLCYQLRTTHTSYFRITLYFIFLYNLSI